MIAPRCWTVLDLLALLALLALLTQSGCGGGDDTDPPDPAVCYVDGKPMPREVCR